MGGIGQEKSSIEVVKLNLITLIPLSCRRVGFDPGRAYTPLIGAFLVVCLLESIWSVGRAVG